jgi:hypothetical protein
MKEAGEMRDFPDAQEYADDDPEELINTLIREAAGRPVMFNFKCRRTWNDAFEPNYDAEPLRQVVMAHPHAIEVGTWTNPGTRNRINCWIIKPKTGE